MGWSDVASGPSSALEHQTPLPLPQSNSNLHFPFSSAASLGKIFGEAVPTPEKPRAFYASKSAKSAYTIGLNFSKSDCHSSG